MSIEASGNTALREGVFLSLCCVWNAVDRHSESVMACPRVCLMWPPVSHWPGLLQGWHRNGTVGWSHLHSEVHKLWSMLDSGLPVEPDSDKSVWEPREFHADCLQGHSLKGEDGVRPLSGGHLNVCVGVIDFSYYTKLSHLGGTYLGGGQ